MKESLNQVFLTGVLVKKELEEVDADVKNAQGQVIGKDKAIRGTVVIRTADGSENEVKYYAARLTKKGTENSLFKGLQTVINEYKALEQFPDSADIVKIGSGKLSINDYKGSDGEVKSFNEIKANFINRVESKDLEATPLESKFEVEGVIDGFSDEIIKEQPTGNVIVKLSAIGYEGTLIPLKLTVPQPLVEPFMSVGFYEGGYAKFVGKLINTKEVTEIVEKMGFGADNIKTVTKTVRRFEITSGNPLGSPIEKGITGEEWDQAKTKRKLKLDNIKTQQSKNANSQASGNPFGATNPTQQAPSSNPFSSNPFAK